jgi:hypothetical protein
MISLNVGHSNLFSNSSNPKIYGFSEMWALATFKLFVNFVFQAVDASVASDFALIAAIAAIVAEIEAAVL